MQESAYRLSACMWNAGKTSRTVLSLLYTVNAGGELPGLRLTKCKGKGAR